MGNNLWRRHSPYWTHPLSKDSVALLIHSPPLALLRVADAVIYVSVSPVNDVEVADGSNDIGFWGLSGRWSLLVLPLSRFGFGVVVGFGFGC